MSKDTKQKENNYLLRNIPENLKKKAQHKAIEEGISFRELILRAVKDYVVEK